MRMQKHAPIYFVFLWLGFFSLAWAADSSIVLGPQLHFDQQDLESKTWNVSAVYLVREGVIPHVTLFFDGKKENVKGIKFASRYKHDYIKFSFSIPQSFQTKQVSYAAAGDKEYTFVVPAIGEPTNILYHSCNGYQRKKDLIAVNTIRPMWYQIRAQHQKVPFHLQLAGGDQLYADGLTYKRGPIPYKLTQSGKVYGVFALPVLDPYFRSFEGGSLLSVSEELREKVQEFYFNAYVDQYRTEHFREAQAEIPSLAQADDHDHYDGFKSYPVIIRENDVTKAIDFEAQWHVNAWQHARFENEFMRNVDTVNIEMKPYNFLKLVSDGKVAIAGIDTRTQRTAYRVLEDETVDLLFDEYERLSDKVKHLIVMLGVPVVYPSSRLAEGLVEFVDEHKIAKRFAKALKQINQFGKVEIADDFRDAWNHSAHRLERDRIVARFQALAERKRIRVTFVSGDVHLGGAGKIYPPEEKGRVEKSSKQTSPKVIYQLISSPVGNIPVATTQALSIGFKGARPQNINDSHMKLIRLRQGTPEHPVTKIKHGHQKHVKSRHYLLDRRNFGRLQLGAHDALNFTLSTEPIKSRHDLGVEHEPYHLIVPPI